MLYGREERTRGLAGLKRSQSARPLLWRCSFDCKSDEEVKVEAFKDAVDGTMLNNIIDNSLASQRHIVTEGQRTKNTMLNQRVGGHRPQRRRAPRPARPVEFVPGGVKAMVVRRQQELGWGPWRKRRWSPRSSRNRVSDDILRGRRGVSPPSSGRAYEAERSTEEALMLYGREERTRGLVGLKRSQSARPLFWHCSFDRTSDEEVKVKAVNDAVDGTMLNNIGKSKALDNQSNESGSILSRPSIPFQSGTLGCQGTESHAIGAYIHNLFLIYF